MYPSFPIVFVYERLMSICVIIYHFTVSHAIYMCFRFVYVFGSVCVAVTNTLCFAGRRLYAQRNPSQSTDELYA